MAPTLPSGRIAFWQWPLVAVRLAALLAALLVSLAAYYLLAPFTRANPVPPLFLRTIGTIAGLRVEMRGAKPLRRGILLANHVSWLDIPALAGATGTAFVAHDGLAGIGALRWLCELNGTVFVARHERRSVAAQIEQVRRAMADSGCLTIFPEGTTSDGTGLLPFKSSLLSAVEAHEDQMAIQPVWLDYGPQVTDMAWVGEEPGVDNALRILARWRPITLTMHFLPPLTGDQCADRKAIARHAREAIERVMAG
ncbi:1-acyl-sn-glycerol-3-phosphate acyltransferase [Novosphingobium sp. PhB165]|uniref:lysophospholipid acyltransferase family protein n=1 Tax=Novosphingobium sp. PhB165 TaxID=2485105 RepID=UPI0010503A60|nr:lysophospholipid acyltransferase family protein [Novosphingobium sp. PhB165]TCM19413.1 1-acyl-sn-glycerol-3-phosphate acyltransferase [Novosphingobium sp. PhB165]